MIFDGDGVGDDRRINLLQRVLASWVASKNCSRSENLAMLNRTLSLLTIIETSRTKSDLVKKTIQNELELYKSFLEKTEKNIEAIKDTIDSSKIILLEVQQEKQHKLTYNMMAESISTVPSRQDTKDIVNKLNNDILNLERENFILNANWVRWRQHFKVIATSANELWQLLA